MTCRRTLRRGLLVAFEGIDGTGKSTQTARLAARFCALGYAVVALHEPTDGPWGQRIREALRAPQRTLSPTQELDLFLQDRRYDVEAHIAPALAARKLVLLDRYYYSTMAYQGAQGLDPEEIRRCNEAFAPKPDLVFVMLLPPALALQRIRARHGPGADLFEQEAYLTRVDAIFRSLTGTHIEHIAADQPLDVVTAVLQRRIQAVLDAPTCL